MRVVKPLSLGLLTRPFEFRRRFTLGVSVLAFCPIGGAPKLLAETGMWAFLGENLPPEVPLDTGMPKQFGEFLAAAHAFSPGGAPAPSLRVGIQLGERIKTLTVTGDRMFDGKYTSQPAPFTTMPIDWQHAYGGKQLPENPLGIGAEAINATPDKLLPLPNIVDPSGALRPAGFGAIDQTWPQRARLAGTHDAAWLKDHFPGFAPDIDWRFFNIAPPDQQFAGPLTGTETYAFEHLHPEHKLITGQLPGIAPRVFATRKGQVGFEEVALRLTTVWFFPHLLRMVLVHHGGLSVAQEDASDVEHLVVGADPLGALRPAAAFEAVMRARTEQGPAAAARALDDSALVPKDWVVPDPAIAAQAALTQGEGIALKRRRTRMENEHARLRAEIIAKGMDPDKLLPPLEPDEEIPPLEALPAFIDAKIAEAKAQQALAEAELEKAKAEQAAKGLEPPATAQPPSGPPDFTAAGFRRQLEAQAAGLRVRGIRLEALEAKLAEPGIDEAWREIEVKLREVYRQGAHLQAPAGPATAARNAEIRAWLSGAALPPADADIYDFHGADLAGLNLAGKNLAGICLDGANLAGANLAGALLGNAVLAHANLEDCNFDGAELSGANLGGARLGRATLRGAVMKKTVLASADLTGARLDGADLEGADFTDAQFAGGFFGQARLPALVLIKADLRGWQAPGVMLEAATFIETDFTGAMLAHAHLAGVSFIGCTLDGVNFTGADLGKCAFVKECVVRAVQFSGASLRGANFRETAMGNCDFTQADLGLADFSGADLTGALLRRVNATGARFTAANLAGASLVHGNFAQGDLARADLRGADLTEGEFYEANLARVRIDETTRRQGMLTVRMRHLPLLEAR
jgi:uncharacterized protein YjbI with pentapeptide repeats